MKRAVGFAEILKAVSAASMLLSIAGIVTAQQQPPVVTHPTTSTVQATPRSTGSSRYGSAAAAQTNVKVAAGTIGGFVYWDMSAEQYKLSSPCQGLTVNVSTISKPQAGGGQVLATTSNFTPTGPMTDLSAQGAPKYMLCSYSFHQMPVGEYLRVRAAVSATAFSSAVSVQNAPDFEIFGGNCNNTPQGTLSFILTGGEMVCGNNAYNINLKLYTTGSPSRGTRPAGIGPLLQNASGTTTSSGGTLKLGSGTGWATTSAGGTLLQSSQGDRALNSQPLPPRTASKASAGSPGANVAQASAAVSDYRQPPGNRESSGPQPPAVSTSSSSRTQVTPASSGFVPKMPPMSSNPKRDATPPAEMGTKEKIKSQLNAQLVAAIPRMARPISAALTTPQSNTREIQALQRQKVFVDSLRTQSGEMKRARIPAQAPPLLVRNQPSTASNPMLHAPQPNQICVAPQVRAVNGKTSDVVFTQDPQYNDYIITGCGFGDQKGQVYLAGAVTGGRIDLVVKKDQEEKDQWSDTRIEAVVKPGLTGVLDGWPDLIVTTANGSSAKFPNSRFYAQRKSVLLPSIPQQYVTLANVKVGDGTHGFGTMYCPGPDRSHLFPCIAYNAGPPLDGITNGHDHRNDPDRFVSNAVDRDGGQVQFDPGEDVYDLSSMAPGFEIDYASANWYAWTGDVCEGWASDAFPKKPGDSVGYDVQGYYKQPYKKTKTKIVVDWGVDHCGWRWLGIFKVDDWYNSGYSLEVYVTGPIGIDPWTGHPVSVARNLGVEQPQRTTPLR